MMELFENILLTLFLVVGVMSAVDSIHGKFAGKEMPIWYQYLGGSLLMVFVAAGLVFLEIKIWG